MAKPDKIRAHLLDQLHLCANHVIGQGRSKSGMVLFAMRAPEQQPLSIEFEGTMSQEFKVAESKAFGSRHCAVRARQGDFATVEDWPRWRPKLRNRHIKCGNLMLALPRCQL